MKKRPSVRDDASRPRKKAQKESDSPGEEEYDDDGLTLFENERKPRELVTDDREIAIKKRDLDAEFKCPVCLYILHETQTVMDCLHRFCDGCISKSLRLGKKECPTCRTKISSKRHLRRDTHFDAMISILYPDLEEYEAKEEATIEEFNKNIMKSQSLLENVEKGKRRQALAKNRSRQKSKEVKEKKEKKEEEEENKDQVVVRKKKEKQKERGKEKEKEEKKKQKEKRQRPEHKRKLNSRALDASFALVLNPEEKNLIQVNHKYVRTSSELSILQICKYLGKKLSKEPHMLELSLAPKNPPLNPELTLLTIMRDHWKNADDIMTLYYKLSGGVQQTLTTTEPNLIPREPNAPTPLQVE